MALIKDVTGELQVFLESIADGIPECRKITTGRRFSDEQIDIQIIFEIGGKELACYLRGEINMFLDGGISFLGQLQETVTRWKYVGAPYKIVTGEREYKAFFTPKQEQKMLEVFSE